VGIYAEEPYYLSVTRCKIFGCFDAITICNCDGDADISYAEITDNSWGITFCYPNGTVTYCTTEHNDYRGLACYYESYPTLHHNSICNNGGYEMSAESGSNLADAEDN